MSDFSSLQWIGLAALVVGLVLLALQWRQQQSKAGASPAAGGMSGLVKQYAPGLAAAVIGIILMVAGASGDDDADADDTDGTPAAIVDVIET